MKSKIVVTADDQGNVIRQTKNPEWGQIRITQKEMTFVNNTGQERTLSALLLAKVEQLKNLNWVEGQTLVGNIIVKEQTEPFNSLSQPKRAGEDGPHCVTEDGEFIYRQTFYDPSGSLTDKLVPHANGDEIRAFYSNSTTATETADNKQVDLEDAIEEAEKEEELVEEDAFDM